MPQSARRPHEWLTLGGGLVTAAVWASNGARAVFADDLAVQALFAWVAFTLAGLALGVVLSVLAAPRRARLRQRGHGGLAVTDLATPLLLLGLLSIGGAADPIFDVSSDAWSWASLIAGSVIGGLLLGSVVVLRSEARLEHLSRTSKAQPPVGHGWR